MRLTAGDVPSLPYACALFDRAGTQLGVTPEWPGHGLGALTYTAGIGTLVVAPDGTSHDVDGLVLDLIGEVAAAAPKLPAADRMAAEMYAAGLALVAGRSPVLTDTGPTSRVVQYCIEGVRRTVPGVSMEVIEEVETTVPTPAALGLGLVQLVRNAARHAGATQVRLRVSRGPTLRVEWPAVGEGASVVTSRRPDQRPRWGMGLTRLLADSLGGVVTAPAPVDAGVVASSIGLGAPRLCAPLALVEGGRVEMATRAWDEETRLPPGSELDARIAAAVAAAAGRPGEIGYADIFRARATGHGTWVAVAPQSSAGRARDVLRGMQHENALLTAPEPHSTRIYALASILAAFLEAEAIEAVAPDVWERDFPTACAALGISTPEVDPDRLRYPDPRVTAFCLQALDGVIEAEPGGLVIRGATPGTSRSLVRLLGGRDGIVTLPA